MPFQISYMFWWFWYVHCFTLSGWTNRLQLWIWCREAMLMSKIMVWSVVLGLGKTKTLSIC